MANPLAQIPPSQLGHIPSGHPPPGVKSNFVDPPSKGPAIITVEAIFIVLALMFLSSRAYVKVFIARKLSWDDLFVVLALLGCIVAYAADIVNATEGGLGKHQWDISLAKSISDANTKGAYVESIIISPTLGLTKLSVFLLYLQLFWPFKWLRVCIYIFATISSAFYFAATVALLVFETPGRHETWGEHVFSAREARANGLSLPTGAIGLAIDIVLLVLPIRAVTKLQMPTRKKVGVVLIFMTGLLACVASLLGTYYRIDRYQSSDINWRLSNLHIMVIVEICAGIICVSAPSVSKIFQHHHALFSSLNTALRSGLRPLRLRSSNDRKYREVSGERPEPSQSYELNERQKRLDDSNKHGSSSRKNRPTMQKASDDRLYLTGDGQV